MFGAKLRSYRRQNGLSLDELSTRTGFSKSFLSQIENGKNSPSIASLRKIADALGVSMGELFEARCGEKVCLTRKAEQKPLGRKGMELVFASSGVAGRRMEAVFLNLEAGAKSEGACRHEGEEFATVLEGRLILSLDGVEYLLEEGDSIYFFSNASHSWRNPSASAMRALVVATPPTF